MNSFEEYCTKFVQLSGAKEGSISPVITPSASYAYATPQEAEAIFDGSVKKPLYARVGNPTTAKFEMMMSEMDGAFGAVATSSGMGALSLATLSLLACGNEVICIGGLFGGCYSYFNETIRRFGITTHFLDADDLSGVEQKINDNTKIIFLESVGNPNMKLPELKKIAKIADSHGVALLLDNTATPLTLNGFDAGVDIVIYSTTKLISGNASALGGCALFRAIKGKEDKFNAPRYSELAKFIKNIGAGALVANAKKRALRDFGMSANAYASYQNMLGLETLALRVERIAQSIEKITLALSEAGLAINHPSLLSHPHHARYCSEFKRGCGPLFTIDFGSKQRAYDFLSASKLITITANIGDSRTLGLHMASTIYRDFSEDERKFLGISDGLVRISVGLENPDELIEDFLQAIES